jgi:hypothetical protein
MNKLLAIAFVLSTSARSAHAIGACSSVCTWSDPTSDRATEPRR